MPSKGQSALNSSLSSFIPSPTTIFSVGYKAAVGTAGSVYSASSWFGGKVFGTLSGLIKSEQKFSAEQAQRARANLPIFEVAIAEKVRSAVTILATGTALYYNPSLTLGLFAALRLMPLSITQTAYKSIFRDDKQAIEQALNTQDTIIKGFTLYYGMLPVSIVQGIVVGGVETVLRQFNPKGTLPAVYTRYNINERLWLWSGTIASVYQDHRFVTNQQAQRNNIEEIETTYGIGSRVNSFNCRLRLQGEHCTLIQQSIAVQNPQTGAMFYAIINFDAAGNATPISIASVATNGTIINHTITETELILLTKQIHKLIDPNIVGSTRSSVSSVSVTATHHNASNVEILEDLALDEVVELKSEIGSHHQEALSYFTSTRFDAQIELIVASTTKSLSTMAEFLRTISLPSFTFGIGAMAQEVNFNNNPDLQIVLESPKQPIRQRSAKTLQSSVSSTATTQKILPILMREASSYSIYPYSANHIIYSESGEYAYLAAGNGGLRIFDIKDILNPLLIAILNTPGNATFIATTPNHPNLLFIADGLGLSIVDIKDIFKPVLITNITTPGYAQFISIKPDSPEVIFVADGSAGVSIINGSDILNPFLVTTFKTAGPAQAIHTSANNNNLLFIAQGDYGSSIVDITNVSNPILAGNISTTDSVHSITTIPSKNNLIFIANGNAGIAIVNITNPVNPILIANLTVHDAIQLVAAIANQVDLLLIAGTAGISIINIQNSSNPILISSFKTAGAVQAISSVMAQDKILLVADNISGLIALEINYEPVMQPNYFELKSSLSFSGNIATLSNANDLLVFPSSSNLSVLIDIANISNPVLRRNYTIPGIINVNCVIPSPNHDNVFFIGTNTGIYILDIKNTSNPVSVANFTTNNPVTAISLLPDNDNLLFIRNGSSFILNVTNIVAPAVVESSSSISSNTSLMPHKYDISFIAGMSGPSISFTALNISNYSNPTIVSTFTLKTPLSFAYFTRFFVLPSYSNLLFAEYGNEASNPGRVSLGEFIIVDVENISDMALLSSIKLDGIAITPTIPLSNYDDLILIWLRSYNGNPRLAMLDISDLHNPIVIETSVGTDITVGTPVSIFEIPKQIDRFWVNTNLGGKICEIKSIGLWERHLPPQRVGKMLQQLFFYSDVPSELLNALPASIDIQLVDSDGITRKDAPSWLNIDKTSLTLVGSPPKEIVGTQSTLEIRFSAVTLSNKGPTPYKALIQFQVINSLHLNKTINNYTLLNATIRPLLTLYIDAVAESATITIQASPPNNIVFITPNNFNSILASFDRITGKFVAIGPVYAMNELLRYLRYISLVPSAEDSTSIDIGLSDGGLNYPITARANMSFFRENQPPVCNKNITEVKFEINSNLDYTFVLGTCSDLDDTIDGATLKYNAFMPNNSITLPLPAWLTFISDQRRFYGWTPAAKGSILIQVNATDGYAIDYFLYRFIFQRSINQAPVLVQPIPLQSAQIGNEFEFVVPKNTFSDPDGDTITVNTSDLPSWLKFNTTSWMFYGNPSPTDTDSFDDRQTLIYLQASDGDKTVSTSFLIAVRGDSLVKLIISYGGTALGILGTVYGVYAYRNQIYNAIAWNRYRYMPTQFGQQVEAVNLFATSSRARRGNITMHQHNIESAVIDKWSIHMRKESDEVGEYYFIHRVLAALTDTEAVRKRKEIAETKTFFVREQPTDTTYQRLKAKLLNKIPVVFNASVGKVFARLGIKMNPNYFAVYEPVIGEFPSWLNYNQRTRTLRVVAIGDEDHTPFDTLVILHFLNANARIMEEISFIVRDESEFSRLFPGVSGTRAITAAIGERQAVMTTASSVAPKSINPSLATSVVSTSGINNPARGGWVAAGGAISPATPALLPTSDNIGLPLARLIPASQIITPSHSSGMSMPRTVRSSLYQPLSPSYRAHSSWRVAADDGAEDSRPQEPHKASNIGRAGLGPTYVNSTATGVPPSSLRPHRGRILSRSGALIWSDDVEMNDYSNPPRY